MRLKLRLKNTFIRIFMLLFLVIASNSVYSQMFSNENKPSKAFAKYCLKFHNYYDGLNEFERLLKLHPADDYYRWGVGYCHLNLNKDKSKSIKFFKAVLAKPDSDKSIWYDLGCAYMQTNNYEESQKAFLKYISYNIKDNHFISAKRQLEMLDNAIIAKNNPIDVEITNAGDMINTKSPDFNPYINTTEKFMVFSRQSPANSGRYRHEDGYYAGDIYYSNFKFGKWRRVKRFSSIINTTGIELNGYLSKNASFLYVYKEDLLEREKKHYIYNKRGKSFGFPKEIKIEGVNMKDVRSLAISNDKKWMIFSAPSNEENRTDLDLYYSKLNSYGEWTEAIAFDSTVNSVYNESFPYFPPNASRFIFASQGHNSIGGYDLFSSDIQIDSAFHLVNIKNIGYPVNTTMDDKTISMSTNCRYAYISTLRKDGFGDLDIYRVVFKNKQPLLTVVQGGIFDQDSTEILDILTTINNHIDTLNFPINKEYKRILLKEKDTIAALEYLSNNKIPNEKLDIRIKAINKTTNQLTGNFIVKESSGRYTVILPPGEYRLIFSRKDFEDKIIDNIIIKDFDLRNRNIEKHILMKQI